MPIRVNNWITKEYVDQLIAEIAVPPAEGAFQDSFLLSGGQVIWQANLDFIVSTADYYIRGVRYQSSQQSLSLDAADPANPRIDVIALDNTGTAVVVTGTPAADPSEPDIDPDTQLKLVFILVGAGATTPGVTTVVLYAENTGDPPEWNGTPSAGSWNLASTSVPRSGSTVLQVTAAANGSNVVLAKASGTVDPNAYNFLILYIRNTVAWPSGRSLSVRFQNAGVTVGNTLVIDHGFFGFSDQNISDYQQVAIPISQFAIAAGALVNQVRIAAVGTGGTFSFRVDDVSLQTDAPTPIVPVGEIVDITYVIDGGGSAITTGEKGHLEVSFDAIILGWTLLADQSGSIVVDVWKDTYANFPPTVADTIAGSEKPTLSAAVKNQDLALTTWTTAITAGDILAFKVDSAATVQRVTLALKARRT